MNNNIILVGRLVHDLELIEDEKGRKYSILTLAINRNYENEYGMYDTDFIDCILYDIVADTSVNYCKKGDIVGVRGRLETKVTTDDNGNKRKNTLVIAEKITFLSTKKESEEDE